MKTISINKIYNVIIDSSLENINNFSQDDFKFLLDKKLVEITTDINYIKIIFVGEVITPNANFLSLPKNFTINEENCILIQDVLKEFKDLEKDDKKLISNKSFYFGENLESEIYYFKKLKKFFLDFITYKFIYPKKELEYYSNKSIKGGTINVVKTISNEDRYNGCCYNVKDISNSKKWNLDDIYYTTLINLTNKYGSIKDKEDIENLKKYLINIGYDFQKIKITSNVIDDIKKCKVGITHYPIKNTLINYYENQKISEKYTIFAFYTTNFCHIWEYFCRRALNHDKYFKTKIKWKEPSYKTSNPDVFSDYNGHKMISDSKYYNNQHQDFTKELHEYNEAQKNQYPMVILLTDIDTKYLETLNHRKKELIKIAISLEELVNDVMNHTTISIDKIHTILSNESVRW